MRISRKIIRKVRTPQIPCIRVQSDGRFILNEQALDLLEMTDTTVDGIVFGYEGSYAYVAYSGETDAFRGTYKIDHRHYSFTCRDEARRLIRHFWAVEDHILLEIKKEPRSTKIVDGYKFLRLKIYEE